MPRGLCQVCLGTEQLIPLSLNDPSYLVCVWCYAVYSSCYPDHAVHALHNHQQKDVMNKATPLESHLPQNALPVVRETGYANGVAFIAQQQTGIQKN